MVHFKNNEKQRIAIFLHINYDPLQLSFKLLMVKRMIIPRRKLIEPQITPFYHVINSCVRRASVVPIY